MEFKNVFIINCGEGVIPHINSIPENLEEERRLFYVAVTRAINNLNIYSTKNLKDKKREVSRFIKECGIDFKLKKLENARRFVENRPMSIFYWFNYLNCVYAYYFSIM